MHNDISLLSKTGSSSLQNALLKIVEAFVKPNHSHANTKRKNTFSFFFPFVHIPVKGDFAMFADWLHIGDLLQLGETNKHLDIFPCKNLETHTIKTLI